ncbi:rRNA cytosine-C5-methyltransferase [Bacteroidia bacterium]|nr:rRNA cytosine-C5-methyltransferase [Bacteroidia bacterium]
MNYELDFIQQMRSLLGNESDAFFDALQQTPPTSIRYNRSKINELECKSGSPVAWCDNAYYLPKRPVFTADPVLHAGGYYVQEASSMLIAHIVKQLFTAPVRALDLCAAPGGKTTLLANALPPQSVVVANETIAHRATILVENVIKWGNFNVAVCQNDPQDFAQLPPLFNLLLVDAPCSGEGMFRKDKASQALWSSEAVQLCATRQRRIVANAWKSLENDGFLIYSTCTFNLYENEKNVDWFVHELGAQCVEIPFVSQWNITPSAALQGDVPKGVLGYHCFPHKLKGEGFFVAVLRKIDGGNNEKIRLPKLQKSISTKDIERTKHHLMSSENLIFEQRNEEIYATTPEVFQLILALQKHLHFMLAARHIADIKSGKWLPTIQLALSAQINKASFERNEVSLADALAYLSRSPMQWQPSVHKGLELVTYQGLPLGFINNLGNRYNNLFPASWRIKSNKVKFSFSTAIIR